MKQIFTIIVCFIIFHTNAQLKQLGTDTIRINVTVAEAKNIIDTTGINPDFIILDVRTASQFASAHIANAINIDYYSPTFWNQIDALDHNKMYLLHCQAGSRSGPTFTYMQSHHFREVYHMNNGLGAWVSAGYPTVSGYTGLQDLSATKLFNLYPNPAQNILFVNFGSECSGKLVLIDMQGKILKEETLYSGLQNIDLSNIPTGIYILKIQSDNDVYTEKITIL